MGILRCPGKKLKLNHQKKAKEEYVMKQKMEVKDNLGNHGFLEFEIPAENPICKNRQSIITAMEFSRMAGILETLGNVPEG